MFLLGVRLLQIGAIHLPPGLRPLALPFLRTEGIATTELCHYADTRPHLVSGLPKPDPAQRCHTCASLTDVVGKANSRLFGIPMKK